jgi:hypothetical protein
MATMGDARQKPSSVSFNNDEHGASPLKLHLLRTVAFLIATCTRYGSHRVLEMLQVWQEVLKEWDAMDRDILKQLLRAAVKETAFPSLSEQETDVYLRHLSSRGIPVKASYWNRSGRKILAGVKITHRSREIDAEIDRILKG